MLVESKFEERGIELNQKKYDFYIDESGRSSTINEEIRDDDKYFILSGLFISPRRIKILEEKCHAVLEKYLDINNVYPELKYSNIMGPRDAYKQLKTNSEELITDILNIIRDENLPLFTIIANKQKHQKIKYNDFETEHDYTTGYMMYKMLQYAHNSNNANVDVIQDDIDLPKKNLIKDKIELRKKYGYRRYGGRTYYENLASYCTDNSVDRIGLQLADICCGTVRRILDRKVTDFYDIIKPLQRRFNNTYGNPDFHPSFFLKIWLRLYVQIDYLDSKMEPLVGRFVRRFEYN